MSEFQSKQPGASQPPASDAPTKGPRQALDALLASPAGDPIRRALWLDELDRRLHGLLPSELAAHARLANVDGDRLVYLVDSPVWHARLRLASAGLVDAARSLGLSVAGIVVRTSTRPLRPELRAAAPARPGGPPDPVAGRYLDAIRTSLHAPAEAHADREGTGPDSMADNPTAPSRTGHRTGPGGRGS